MLITIHSDETVEIARLEDGHTRVLVKRGAARRVQIDTLSTHICFVTA